MTELSLHTDLVSRISHGRELNSIFFYSPLGEKCHLEGTLSVATSGLPLVIWKSEKTVILNGFLGEGTLVVACLPGLRWRNLLNSLSRNLNYLRQVKILIELKGNKDDILVRQVLEFCQSQDMINVNVIFDDFVITKYVYSFDSFPMFKIVRNSFGSDSQVSSLYPDKMSDLRGGKIRTMPDYSEPNTILYEDKQGNKQIMGYLWDIMEAYAHKHNARLHVVNKYADGRTLNFIELLDVGRSGIIDVAASIQPMSMGAQDRYHEMSYPVDVTSWCTMLPVERDLDVSELLSRMMPYSTFIFLALIWICYEVLRGRWRRHQRMQKIGWLVLATMLSSNYLARLLTYLANPTSEPQIDSLAALIETPVRIFSLRSEYSAIEFTKRTKYSAAFRLTYKASDLIARRNSLNTSFGYTITNTKWKLFEEQQKHSSRPLFRYSRSQDLCFYEVVPFGFVIQENSPHRATIHHFSLQLRESGLFDLWVSRGFSYMVRAGKMHFADLREPYRANTLNITDLRNVFAVLGIGVGVSVTLFACELIVNWIKLWLDIL
ncbi:uncharacterized protein LOC110185891 [Drosophila serrata]|uniref:uncharacterized protein LOC110185891 n=1 Tax=Drosophila serrata TaxID=7274 RepID=UPI000A1D1248|nr:uncharacterized protein LOC110185891 [Drosophila serrata]